MNPAFREGSPAIHGRPTREGRIRKLVAFLAPLILCRAANLPARAENWLALVIGEDTYEQIAPLRKAVADARAGTLRGKGYSVSEGYDVKTLDLEADVAAVVHAVGYSPDGRMLASGSADGVIGILDATLGATLFASGVNGVAVLMGRAAEQAVATIVRDKIVRRQELGMTDAGPRAAFPGRARDREQAIGRPR
jgi:hypothetical protein